MEFRDYLALMKHRRYMILLMLVITLGAGALLIYIRPERYQSMVSIVTNYQEMQTAQTKKQNEEYFKYNNYYGTLIAESFNESISGLLKNSGVVQAVFEEAQLKLEDKEIRNPGKYFRSTAKSNHVTEIIFYADSCDEANDLSNALIVTLQEKANDFVISQGEGKLELGIEGPVIEKMKIPWILYLVILALVGLGFGIGLVMLLHYLADEVGSVDELTAVLDLPLLGQYHGHNLADQDRHRQSSAMISDQLLLSQKQHQTSLIGILGSDAKQAGDVLSLVHSELKQLVDTEISDLSNRSDTKLADIKKHKAACKLVLLPQLFSQRQRSTLLDELDLLLIILPALGFKRDQLTDLKNLLAKLDVPKGLILVN